MAEREDDIVEVSTHRIETAELEATTASHRDVAEPGKVGR
jgi:acyl-coenzyme A synthetase/AMP-(fatty) acid ligase